MGKRGRVQSGSGVQMFPFLDALICTMGALLVLLHAFARHGQVEAVKKAEATRSTQRPDELQADLEETQWRISQLDETRGKTATQLADDRLRLSHVEDHARRLRQQLDQLRGAMAATEQLGGADTQERQQELVAAAAKVRQAQQALAEALRTAKQRSATYSVVPYEGPNVTRRRPVYIECRAESVVLQPEGIELAPEDFSLLGPGNPLASTLRAMQEYFTRQSGGANASEPYPLLLVRPEGVGAYYAARAALDTWGSDFGYELVGSDWKLTFPEPDSRLAELTRKVLAEARVRQQEYVLASSQLARSRPRATFHASARGGFAAERGTGGGRGGASGAGAGGWDSLGSNWAARRGPGSGGDGSGKSGTPDDGSSALAGAGGGTGVNGGGSSGAASAGLGPGGGSLASNSGNPGAGSRYQVADARYGSASARGADGLATDNGPPSGNGGSDTTSAQARPGGMSSDTSSFAGGQGSPSAGSANRPPGSAGGSTSSGGSTSPGGSSSSGGSSSPDGTPSAPSLSLNATVPSSQSKKTKSMATARGRNWGLPDTGPAAAAATRPILVECHNDRLVILPESSNQVPKEVPLGPKAQDSMDEFVSDVWKHMKSWGIAGKGLYWRPTLLMEVKPGAADRYAEVKALLDDSGLDVHERQPHAAAAQPPARSTRK